MNLFVLILLTQSFRQGCNLLFIFAFNSPPQIYTGNLVLSIPFFSFFPPFYLSLAHYYEQSLIQQSEIFYLLFYIFFLFLSFFIIFFFLNYS